MNSYSTLGPGVYTATLTPLKKDLSVDYDLLVAHCKSLLNRGSTGIALLGTTGEANSFSTNERKKILEKTVEAGVPPEKLMVGTGCCSLPETVELTQHATSLKASGVLVIPPFYYKSVGQKGIADYFELLIEKVNDPRLRIYLYQFPKMSGVSFGIPLIKYLNNKYPENIVGIKDSSGDFDNMKNMIENFPAFDVFAGTEKYLLDILKLGGAGCISATANVTVSLAAEVFQLWGAGKEAGVKQEYLTKVRTSFEGLPFSTALKSYIAFINNNEKWVTVRPPLVSLDPSALNELKNQLNQLDFNPTKQI